jgi:hypothetical protein
MDQSYNSSELGLEAILTLPSQPKPPSRMAHSPHLLMSTVLAPRNVAVEMKQSLNQRTTYLRSDVKRRLVMPLQKKRPLANRNKVTMMLPLLKLS